MKKLKTPTAVTTGVLTLITIIFWAGFELYRAFTIKPTPTVPAEIMNPLDPSLDTKSLDGLGQKLFIPETQINNVVVGTSTPAPTPSPIPTNSPTPIPTPTP